MTIESFIAPVMSWKPGLRMSSPRPNTLLTRFAPACGAAMKRRSASPMPRNDIALLPSSLPSLGAGGGASSAGIVTR